MRSRLWQYIKEHPEATLRDCLKWMNNQRHPMSFNSAVGIYRQARQQAVTSDPSAVVIPDKAGRFFNPPRIILTQPPKPVPVVETPAPAVVESASEATAPAVNDASTTLDRWARGLPNSAAENSTQQSPLSDIVGGDEEMPKKRKKAPQQPETLEARRAYARELAEATPLQGSNALAAQVKKKFGVGLDTPVAMAILAAARKKAGHPARMREQRNFGKKKNGGGGVAHSPAARKFSSSEKNSIEDRKRYLVDYVAKHPDSSQDELREALIAKFGKAFDFKVLSAAIKAARRANGVPESLPRRKSKGGPGRGGANRAPDYEQKIRFAEDLALEDPSQTPGAINRQVFARFGTRLNPPRIVEILAIARSAHATNGKARAAVAAIAGDRTGATGALIGANGLAKRLHDVVKENNLRALHLTVTDDGTVTFKAERYAIEQGRL